MGQIIAYLFPGQGSQSVGMLAEFSGTSLKDTFDEASDVLGFDCWSLAEKGPKEQLNETTYTQPVLLTASVGLWRLFEDKLQKPQWLAGHSLGEYAALVCGGALAFEDALRLVHQRGQLMQSAAPLGSAGMVAVIGLEDQVVQSICEEISVEPKFYVAAANFNAPGQVVVAGTSDGVDMILQLAKSRGAKLVKKLPVSVPSHCDLMKEMASDLASAIAAIRIQSPVIPVIHNVDAQSHEDPESIRQALAQQVYSPVYWSQSIGNLLAQGVNAFVECGPGKVLTGLNKRIAPDALSTPITEHQSLI